MPRRISLRVIRATDDDPQKTGCLACPALAYFSGAESIPTYRCDIQKIRGALKVPHENAGYYHTQEYTPVDVLIVFSTAPVTRATPSNLVVAGYHRSLLEAVTAPMEAKGLRVGVTSLVRCRLPANPGKTVIRACSPELLREYQARKPKVLVAVGGPALTYLTEQTGVDVLCGKPIKASREGFDGITVVPVINTSQLIAMDHEAARFEDAFAKAAALASGEQKYEQTFGEYTVCQTVEQVEQVLDTMSKAPLTTFDTETGALSPFQRKYPALLCVSVSNKVNTGYTIPYDHEGSPWFIPDGVTIATFREKTEAARRVWQAQVDKRREANKGKKRPREKEYKAETKARLAYEAVADRLARMRAYRKDRKRREDRNRVREALRKFLTSDVRKGGQNFKFDLQVLYYELGVWPTNCTVDTLYTHYALDDRRGTHGLDKLAHAYTAKGSYDLELDQWKRNNTEAKESYFNIPDHLLFRYAAIDADVTLESYTNMVASTEYRKRRRILENYTGFLCRLGYTLARMEYNGVYCDRGRLRNLRTEYAEKIDKLTLELRSFPQVAKLEAKKLRKKQESKGSALTLLETRGCTFSPTSPLDIRALLFEECKFTPVALSDAGLEVIAKRYDDAVHRAQAAGNVDDPGVDADDLIRRAVAHKEWGLFSTAADILHELARGTEDKLIPTLLDLREATTIYNTFLAPLEDRMDGDGLVHGSFIATATETGRLASRQPNLQNIPSKDGNVKCLYTSRFENGLILSADYSQIELRVAAAYYDEPLMAEAYRQGADLHTMTAQVISGLSMKEYKALDASVAKRWRSIAKRVNFLIVYGGAGPALSANLKKDGIFIDADECQRMIDTFLSERPGLVAGIKAVQDEAQAKGYLDVFTGFRRRLPQVFSSKNSLVRRALRQVVNCPIQHIAAYMMLLSLVVVEDRLLAGGFQSVLSGTVHDSMNVDCTWDELPDVAVIVKDTMENIADLSREVLPGLDWSWLNVPIVADLEVGYSWGEQTLFSPALWGTKPEGLLLDPESKKPVRSPVNNHELRLAIDAVRKFDLTKH